jgi:hypothetical protein
MEVIKANEINEIIRKQIENFEVGITVKEVGTVNWARLKPATDSRVPAKEFRYPRRPGCIGRYLGPLSLSRRPIRLRHVHARLPLPTLA